LIPIAYFRCGPLCSEGKGRGDMDGKWFCEVDGDGGEMRLGLDEVGNSS
jgi:hypothetical protein